MPIVSHALCRGELTSKTRCELMLRAYICNTIEIAHSTQMTTLCSLTDSSTTVQDTHTITVLMYEPHAMSMKSCSRKMQM